MTVERRKRLLHALANRFSSFSILLENIFDPHNIAAVFRTCDSVGIQEVHILQTHPHLKPKKWSKRTSSSANKWLNIIQHDNLESCVKSVKEKYKVLVTTGLSTPLATKTLYEQRFPSSCIIAFGNESTGLSNNLMQFSDINIAIPQNGLIKSLNISVACAVTMYEVLRQKQQENYFSTEEMLQHKWMYTSLLNTWELY